MNTLRGTTTFNKTANSNKYSLMYLNSRDGTQTCLCVLTKINNYYYSSIYSTHTFQYKQYTHTHPCSTNNTHVHTSLARQTPPKGKGLVDFIDRVVSQECEMRTQQRDFPLPVGSCTSTSLPLMNDTIASFCLSRRLLHPNLVALESSAASMPRSAYALATCTHTAI